MTALLEMVARGTPLPRLREVRTRLLFTQEELAKAAGVSRGTLSRIEDGGHPAEIRTVRKLATALGVEPALLMASTPS